MSLIGLRQTLRRQGRRAAVVLVMLSLGLLAAHHAGVHQTHGMGGAGGGDAAMQHGPEMPPVPAVPVDQVVAVCLAVLPLLLAVALGTSIAVLVRRWWRVAAPVATAPLRFAPDTRLRPPRAGPRLLCVMRC